MPLHLQRGGLFSGLDVISCDGKQVIESQGRDLRLLLLGPEARLSDTSAFGAGLAPRSVRGVPSGLVLIDLLLRWRTGVPEEPRLLTLFDT